MGHYGKAFTECSQYRRIVDNRLIVSGDIKLHHLYYTRASDRLCRAGTGATPFRNWSARTDAARALWTRESAQCFVYGNVERTRHNPVIKPFYARLRAAGKPVKVARCAAARKLLHLVWAVVSKAQDFDPNYAARVQQQPAA